MPTQLVLMVIVALAVRLIVMTFLYPEQLDPQLDHWKFGYETGRVARSIAMGDGISNPLYTETGPTAFVTPVYVYLAAGVFHVFGIYTKASALVLLSLNALTSSLTCIPVVFFASKSFGYRVGLWSGWAWALFPYSVYFPVERIWPTWLATLVVSILFWIALHLEDTDSVSAWSGYGLLWGFAGLVEPIVLSILPFLSLWACYRLSRHKQRWLLPAAASAAAFIVVVSPWFVRNYRVFHQFIPFRDTMGLEWIIGNSGDSFLWRPRGVGPWHNESEWTEFKSIGELNYMAKKKRQAFEFIKGHPAWFVRQTFRRALYLWTGYWSLDYRYLKEEPLDPPNILFCTGLTVFALLGLRRAFQKDITAAMPYAIVLFFFPLVYYFTHPEVYYRRQIDPQFLVLAVFALTRATAAAPETTLSGDNEDCEPCAAD